MINFARLMLYAISISASSFSSSAEASPRLLSATEAKLVEANYNKAVSDGETWELQKDQAFAVALNSGKLKDVIFASFKNEAVQFVLLSPKGDVILQTFPKSDLSVVNIFSFMKVEAVSFKELNGDGTKDILALATYFDSRPVQGEGVGGGKVKVGFAFMSHKDEFELEDQCGGDVANLAALEKCVKKNLKK